MASPDTVRRRLRPRGGRDPWAEEQTERCTTALARPRFARHLATDDLGVGDVVEDIARDLGLELRAPRRRRTVLRRLRS